LGGLGLGFGGLGGNALAAGLLELVEAALGFVGFSAEADGTAAEAEDFCQRHVRGRGLAEGLEGEGDGVGGASPILPVEK
jgi:hypothetical protein